MRRMGMIAAATTAVASMMAMLATASAADASLDGSALHSLPVASPAWKVEPTLPHDGTPLVSVACVSRSFCVAVGGKIAERWNGTAWSRMRAVGGAAVLFGVACPSATRCFAVGGDVSGRAAVWSWHGTTWASQRVPNPASQGNELTSIWCASARRCEAVGSHGNPNFEFPLAEVWNGRAWKRQSTFGAPDGTLAGVSCESPSRCEAVGSKIGKRTTTLAMRWNGSKWTTQRTPVIPDQFASPPGEPYQFDGVSCWSSGCTAVGTDFYCDCSSSAEGDILLAERWTGSAWRLQGRIGTGVSPTYASAAWNAVYCRSASACTAVGTWTDDNQGQPLLTLVSTWNGTSWRQVSAPSPSKRGDALNAIDCLSSVCTSVGVQKFYGTGFGDSLAMRD